jgi:hypothetical protein
MRHAYLQTRAEPHPSYPLDVLRGAAHERQNTGTTIVRFIIEQAMYNGNRRKRYAMDVDSAFARIDADREPAYIDPERPLTDKARDAVHTKLDQLGTQEPAWHIGKLLIDELSIQQPYAIGLVAEATLAAAIEIERARSMPQAA